MPSLRDQEYLQQVKPKIQFAADRLKEKYPASLTLKELIDYSFPSNEAEIPELIRFFKRYLAVSEIVSLDETTKTYRYKPPYDVATPEQLIAYFQGKTDVQPIEVKELKKGWPDCEKAIDQLEKEHKLIVMRGKRDLVAKTVWADDPDLFAPIDEEFVQQWEKINFPATNTSDEIRRYLQSTGRTPAGQIAQSKVVAKSKATAKRRVIRSAKQTNKHMAGQLRDYSALARGGK